MRPSESEATAKIPAIFRHRFTLDAVSVVVGRLLRMPEPFIGSERTATGALTPYALRSKFVAIYPDIYVSPAADVTAVARQGGVAVVPAPGHRRGAIGCRAA